MKVVIFSQDSDTTTTEIIQWTAFFKIDVVRINLDDPNFKILSLNHTATIRTSFGVFDLLKSDIYWFRRAKLFNTLVINGKDSSIAENYFYALEDMEALNSLYYWIIDNCKFYANPFTSFPNKLHALRIAKRCGCLIPDTIFSTQKTDIKLMLNKYSKLAVKPFTGINTFEDNVLSKSLTTCIQEKDLESIPDEFGGLIIQNYIEKKYELRCFFFLDEFYTMAIFSQNDEKTKVDFRNYNKEKPNKNVCFTLSEKYKKKLSMIAKKLDIISGSFDILVDGNDYYYFLEVNPIGQFGMVSHPCNYNIEKKIAYSLIKKR